MLPKLLEQMSLLGEQFEVEDREEARIRELEASLAELQGEHSRVVRKYTETVAQIEKLARQSEDLREALELAHSELDQARERDGVLTARCAEAVQKADRFATELESCREQLRTALAEIARLRADKAGKERGGGGEVPPSRPPSRAWTPI
jgi:uncharacterized coiled-coil DUF342 family protein